MTAVPNIDHTQLSVLENEQFDPHEFVLGLILNAVSSRTNVEITLRGSLSRIIIQANLGEAVVLVDKEVEFYTAQIKSFRVKALNDDFTLSHSHGPIQNIDELTWTAAYHASQGRLMEGCKKTDILYLKYWPNLTAVPKTNSDISMCALFARHPTSMHVAKKMLDITQQDLNRFYSAARASGLSAIVNSRPDKPVSQKNPNDKRPLFRRILDKIASI